MVAILSIMSFIISFLFLFLFNSVLGVIEFINGKCVEMCLMIYLIKSTLGILSTIIAISMFFIIKLQFLKILNLNENDIINN